MNPMLSGLPSLEDLSDPEMLAKQLALAQQLRGQGADTAPEGNPEMTRLLAEQLRSQGKAITDAQAAHDAASANQYGFGNLGIASGDKVLGDFGRAQLADIKAFNPTSLRGLTLQQGAQRLALQQEAEARKLSRIKNVDQFNQAAKLLGIGAQLRGQNLTAKALENTISNQAQSQEAKLRDDFVGDPITKAYNVASSNIAKFRAAVAHPSGSADLATIFTFMKLLDPGAAVQEGDVANARSTVPGYQRLQSYFLKLKDGQQLTPDQRADMLRTGEAAFAATKQQYDVHAARYRYIAQQNGISPERVVVSDIDTMQDVKEPTRVEMDALGKTPTPAPGQPDINLDTPVADPRPTPGKRLLKRTELPAALPTPAPTQVPQTTSTRAMTADEKAENNLPSYVIRKGESLENAYLRNNAGDLPDFQTLVTLPVPKDAAPGYIRDNIKPGETVKVAFPGGAQAVYQKSKDGKGLKPIVKPRGF